MPLSKETADAIRAELKRQKLTQRDLAKKLGASDQYISDVLACRQTISMARADEIVAALGCRIKIELQRSQ